MDPRTAIDPNERVYFHDKCAFAQKGYAVLEGAVIKTAPEQYQVMLDQDIKPESQSGSPVISQTTGKVIGIVAGTSESGDDAIGTLFGARRKVPSNAGAYAIIAQFSKPWKTAAIFRSCGM